MPAEGKNDEKVTVFCQGFDNTVAFLSMAYGVSRLAKAFTPTGRERRWLLIALLALLHLLLIEGIDSGVGRMLLVMHIGTFILWQPFVRAEQRLSPVQLGGIALAVVAAVSWINWGLLILWVMLLAGIVGGKVFFFAARAAKLLYLIVLAYLVSVLLVFMVPQILPRPFVVPAEFAFLATYVLPGLFLPMALLPVESEAENAPEVIDFLYSAFVLLVLAVLVLGSVAAMLLFGRGYIESLVLTLAVLSGVLFLLAWAWNPRAGFGGLNALFSRYLLSIGLPVERWLHYLAEHAQREDRPETFLDDALAGMASLPWVIGGTWQVRGHQGGFGVQAGRRNAFGHGELAIVIFTREPIGPALVWHFDLLTRLLGEFYGAKLRTLELQQLSYVKAIHETGARLTHDVKNLLQSLNTLCFAAAAEGGESSPQFQALLRRQLPAIAQRLQQTLDKLQRPATEAGQYQPLRRWWAALRARYGQSGIEFSPATAGGDAAVPAVLFDSVAENLIENALAKRREAAGLRIRVSLESVEGAPQPCLRVCDDGAAIPAGVAEALFTAPVASSNGLGIGLYQAARHADFYRYVLRVACNRPGEVCFELREAAPGEATSP